MYSKKLILLLELNKCSYITGPVSAYERCWFLGDDFGSRSFQQYFQQRKSIDYNGYIKSHFDTCGFFNNFTSENPSIIARFASTLSVGIQSKTDRKILPLPKIVVVVPEDDLLKTLGEDVLAENSELTTAFCKLLNFIMTEFDRCVSTFKENLPAKSVRFSGYPHFLWIQPPSHINFKNNSNHFKFSKALEDVVKLHTNVHTLQLKKVWDPNDPNLYLESGRFTTEGFKAYWEAVDKTARYFDSVVLKKNERKKVPKNTTKMAQNEQFRWKNPALNKDDKDDFRPYRRLPVPPPQRRSIQF